MRSTISLLAAAAAALAAAPSMAALLTYSAALSGAAEAPPNGSPGTGTAKVILDDQAFTMQVIASFSGLNGNVTVAHIHCCTPVPGAGTIGVATVTPTFTGFPSGVKAGSYDHVFDMTLTSGSWNPSFISANGGSPASAFAALSNGLLLGKAYLNIHTTAVPGGEIRGFLQVPEPQSGALVLASLAGLALASPTLRPAARRRASVPR